jgi:hypothetical protein
MHCRQRASFIVTVLTCASAAGVAAAEPASSGVEPIRVVYSAPSGCPSALQFLQELGLRTERARLAAPDEPARRFAATIGTSGAGSAGRLEIEGTDGVVTSREVTGSDCVEVASALTLVAALAIDPQASLMPRAELLAGTSTAAPEPEAPEPAPAFVAPAAPSAAGERPDGVSAPPAATPPGPARVAWSAGATLGGTFGLVPSAALGGGVFAGFAPDADDPLVPSFRLGVLAAFASPAFSGSIGADLSWWVSRLEVCPLRPLLVSPLRLELCADFDAGVLRSTGTGLDHPDSTTSAWLAPGAVARLVFSPGGGSFVELAGGVVVPLRQYPFYYQVPGAPQTSLYEMPPVAATLALGAGYELP